MLYSSMIRTNTNDAQVECSTSTSSEDSIADESDSSENTDSSNINQATPQRRKKDETTDTTKSLTRSLSTLAIATNANLLNLPLSSLTLAIKPNSLELPHDRKHRQKTYNMLNQLIFGIRQQKLKRKEIYELPPLVKQIIRCLYPSDIDGNNCLQKPDIVFNLKSFIELFRI
ncbi:unnamed protein product [Rotaria magnacalcarata]|uniref:Uncharacterized protein n=1 Tax=Rotaria magnacalcarata TaxID=392030 RepID=A0A8S3GP87_9BILA|nr:unnamed protein product [Rotaria magnacalcarata]CAF5210322.1 unnamed protein product [Rotaria magnacalcarata]